MKTVFNIVLVLCACALVYICYASIMGPINFEKEEDIREKAVIARLVDIRKAQTEYRNLHDQQYTASFDSLINFVKYDSLTFEHAIGSADDSLAVAQGRVSVEKFQVAVKDTIQFISPEVLQDVNNLRYIPGSVEATGSMQQFVMDTASIETESRVVVPVFEAFAQYPTFLGDLDKQELINFRDYQINTLNRADGLKVGSLTATTNEAGNWDGE